MKKISSVRVNNKRLHTIAERFIAFAIIQPNATKVEIKQRAKIINVITAAIIGIVIIISIVAYQIKRQYIIQEAIGLHNKLTCNEEHGKKRIICLPKDIWKNTSDDVKEAWVDGERIAATPKHEILVIDDENHQKIGEIILKISRPVSLMGTETGRKHL